MRVFVVGAKSQALLSYHILVRAGHSVPYVFDSDRTVPKPPWDACFSMTRMILMITRVNATAF